MNTVQRSKHEPVPAKNYVAWGSLLLLIVAIGLAGCSKPKGQDEKFVRQVLTALYAGSSVSIKAECFSPEAMNRQMSELAPKVNQLYGAVKSLKHAGSLAEQYGVKQEAWIVTCERSAFRLQLMMTAENGQLNGIWVDPAP